MADVLEDLQALRKDDPLSSLAALRKKRADTEPGVIGKSARAIGKGLVRGTLAIPQTIVGTPIQIAKDIAGAVTKSPVETAKEWGQRALMATPPTFGMMAGGALGGPLGAVGGAAAGGLVSELMRTGKLPGGYNALEETAAQVPSIVLGDLIAKSKEAVGGVVKRLPGAPVGIHEVVAKRLRNVAEGLLPEEGAVDAAYGKLPEIGNPLYRSDNFRARLQEYRNEAGRKEPALQDPQWIGFLDSMLESTKGPINGQRYATIIRDLGEKLRPPKGGGIVSDPHSFLLKRDARIRGLMNAAWKDLEDVRPYTEATFGKPDRGGLPAAPAVTSKAVGSYKGQEVGPQRAPEGQTVEMERTGGPRGDVDAAKKAAFTEQLKLANRLHRRQRAAESLGRDIEDSISTTSDAYETVGGLNKLITTIERARNKVSKFGDKKEALWVKTYTPAELDDIAGTLKAMKKNLPAMPPGKGVITGSSKAVPRAVVGAAVGGVTGALTHDPAVAGMVGSAAATVAPALIAKAMTSKGGRAMVRAAMDMDPEMGAGFRSMLTIYLRTQAALNRGEQPEDLSVPKAAPIPTPAPVPTPTPQALAALRPKGEPQEAQTR